MSAIIRSDILPLPAKGDDEEAWVDRLILVATYCNEDALKSLDVLTGLKGYQK
jgi:hypothetical protein